MIFHINSKLYRAHRLAWLYVYGEYPKKHLDHINGIRNDKRIITLRECNDSQNMKNTDKRKDNTSGCKGVSFDKARNKWKAQATLNQKHINIGRFDSKEDASLAYQSFAKANHGDFYYKHELKELL